MYSVTPVFTQVMDFMSLKTFQRCVQRYRGNFGVKNFTCLDQFRTMAFAQLTYRESLRDIEACLRAQSKKLYHMGIRSKVSRSTLAEANETRDWHIYADFAHHLIGIARKLYQKEPLAVELKNTVYALDATTIDLCLSIFPWAQFPPGNKGSPPTSYPAGPAGQYLELYPYHRRKNPRSQCAGYDPSGSRRLLHHESRLPGLLQTPCHYSGIGVLHYPGQVEFEEPQDILPSCKQAQRRRL